MATDSYIIAKLAIVSPTGCPQARRTAKALARGARRVPGIDVRILAGGGTSRLRCAVTRYSRHSTGGSNNSGGSNIAAPNQAPPVTTQQLLTSADGVLFGLNAADNTVAGRVRAFSELLGALWSEDALDAQLTGAYFLDAQAPVHNHQSNDSESDVSSDAESDGSDGKNTTPRPMPSSSSREDGAFTLLTYWSKQHQSLGSGPLAPTSVSRASSTSSSTRPRSLPDTGLTADAVHQRKRHSASSDSGLFAANTPNSIEKVIEDRGEQFAQQLAQLKLASVNSAVRRRFNSVNGDFAYLSGARSAQNSTFVSRHTSTTSRHSSTRSFPRTPTSDNFEVDNVGIVDTNSHYYANLYQQAKLSPTTAARLSKDTNRSLPLPSDWDDTKAIASTSSKHGWRGIRNVFRTLARSTMG
ncbi:hypothetical protein BDF19DRAFT_445991 [Syncephalis fuscata]|nr:hypothetical protein BDF19DRAFT_445991 [Syncephalis fuscata]